MNKKNQIESYKRDRFGLMDAVILLILVAGLLIIIIPFFVISDL